MNATLLSNRAARSMMVLGALALTACDTDRSVGPSMSDVATPQTANAAKLGTSARRAAWAVRDEVGNLVGGATFTWNEGLGIKTIVDNSPADLDPTPGEFEVVSITGNSGICPITAPAGYVWPATGCFGIPIPPGGTTFVATFTVFPEYSMNWALAGSNGLIGPATFSVKGKTIRYSATILDNGANDRDATIGRVSLILPGAGEYEVCMAKAVPGTKFDTTCFRKTVQFGAPLFFGVFYSPTILLEQ